MSWRAIRLAGSACAAMAVCASTAVSAQAYYRLPPAYHDPSYARASAPAPDRYGYARKEISRGGYGHDGYYENGSTPSSRHQASYRNRHIESCNDGSASTILGAIAGGLLGDAAVGRHGSRAARAEALIGHAVDRDCN